MHDIHSISLYESLGHSTFTAIMKNVFEQDVGGDSIDDFITMMSVHHGMWRRPVRIALSAFATGCCHLPLARIVVATHHVRSV